MDYQNIPEYKGEMSTSDLCDAIVEARGCDLPEIRTATRMLVDDLRDAILNAPVLYYLKSEFTNSPYLNERFCVVLFDDEYYAQKYVDTNVSLDLTIEPVNSNQYENIFSKFYNVGAEGLDFCNGDNGITFSLKHFFLSDKHEDAEARLLSRFILLCMQEIRNDSRQYERKEEIVVLLKKNIIAEALTTKVFVPTHRRPDDSMRQFNVATMTADNKDVFFPIYTDKTQFTPGDVDMVLMPTSLLSYIEFISQVAEKDERVFGLAINPESVNFAMNKGIMEIVLANKVNQGK